tara:strand:- start:219 stop:731 length:513 start_codon:yes stop_codon:yes gene_type:complete
MTTESNGALTGLMTYLDDNKEDMKNGHYCELAGLILKARSDMEDQVSKTTFYNLTYISFDVIETCWSGENADRRFEIENTEISRIFKADDIIITHRTPIADYDTSKMIGSRFALEDDKALFVRGPEKFNKHFYRLDPENNYGVRGCICAEDEPSIIIEVPNPILIGIEKL